MASFQKTATILFYRQYDKPQTPSKEIIILTGDDDNDDNVSRFSDHENYGSSKSNVDGEANSGTANTDTNDTSNESRFSCVLTSNENDSDDESLFPSHENDKISNSNVDGEANNGTGNTDTNDTSHINQDVEAVENVEKSNDSTIQKVSTSIIISATFQKYYTFHLYFTFNFSVIKDTRSSPIYAWKMGNESDSRNPFGERCHIRLYRFQITCAHDGCNAKVHWDCQ